ncbi:SRPBCC family protein [Nesterenkonia lutea]|uniref:Ribosome-associated toxin RatA of RatAB toxin-antitoxin module n=1 Tax=Nesterenkonia lutea TaxID=272919 RepID=A0ABR9JBX5_9MICC|nr:SRPBCC family protein [Nesterenkonia lutea]MBE1523442.1 ribosome-associated toxin RatA of RatAB toxin-antitoxin module [Nesterenkonia lutea]
MSTRVEEAVVVEVPLSTAYDQWTQFEEFPRFMGGVASVRQLSEKRLEWVAEIGGVRRQWEADIVEQVPDSKIAWTATEGATNTGEVTFSAEGDQRTRVNLVLEYEPADWVEKAGDKLNLVKNRAEKDLERFKEFIESEGRATGAWRGTIGHGPPSSAAADALAWDSADDPTIDPATAPIQPDGDDEPVYPEDRPLGPREVAHEPDRPVIDSEDPR